MSVPERLWLETAVGGSPHPSEEGHQKIANAVNAVLKQ
jgi:hypothetical protein